MFLKYCAMNILLSYFGKYKELEILNFSISVLLNPISCIEYNSCMFYVFHVHFCCIQMYLAIIHEFSLAKYKRLTF